MAKSFIDVKIELFDELPRFLELDATEKTRVIRVGLEAIEHAQQRVLGENSDEWTRRIEAERLRHNSKLVSLQEKENELRKEIASQRSKFASEKEELSSSIRQNVHSIFKAEIDSLTSRNNQLQSQLNSQSSKFQSQLDSSLKEWREHYESRLASERQAYEEMRVSYEDKLNALVGRAQNSTIKGQEGEMELFMILNRLFPTALIEDTHTIPGRGDFIVQLDGLTMMVENKNYTRNVQKSEVDKFYRDIESSANSDVQCGVLLSMNCGISCKEDFSVEIRNGKPVMFLHCFKDNPNHVKLAAQLFQVLIGNPSTDLGNAEQVGKLSNLAKAVKRNYQTQKKQLDKFYKDQTNVIEQQNAFMLDLFNIVSVKY